MNKTQPNRRHVLLAGTAAMLGTPLARAQSAWPSKPVTIVVPFPPGGGTDAFARPLFAAMTKNIGRQFVIDNKGGAGGTLGAGVAAKAAPDGYTFFMGAVHHAIAPSMYPKLDYNIETDFVPVGLISSVPQVIVVNPQKVQATTLPQLLDYIRKNPGKLNYGSAGNGTSHHLAGELFKLQTKTFITHIPYRGAGPALQDLIAGQVDMMFDGLGSSRCAHQGRPHPRHCRGLRQARARLPRRADLQATAACRPTRSPPGTDCGRPRARRPPPCPRCRPR
jgi:tripartite-type tricarboxylate transporter receptor subunit TctC